jgi:uncharacterized damage-inducible protein DinB
MRPAEEGTMVNEAATLASFYTGWERYQNLLTEALAPLSADDLAQRATPSLRPTWVLAAHIIAARVYWFHRVLGEGEPEIAPLQSWDDDGEPQRDAADLVRGLEESWRMIAASLARWTPAMLDAPFPTSRGRVVTRQWVIWHVIEHDLHHGGELFFTLGMHGHPTPDL